jgi:hypothetical protein
MTPCGEMFEHDWHGYRTADGKVRVCDGQLKETKR